MASRNELVIRANVVGLDPATYPNDSKLEQKVLWLEKRATTFAGTLASGTLTSDNTQNSDGDTVTIGTQVYTYKTALSALRAIATLTSDATAPADGDRVTIEGQTYVFRTALTNTVGAPNEVLIGVSAAVALDNLKSAINADGTAGVYGAGTNAHPLVTATTNGNTTQVVQAIRYGDSKNSYVTTETSAHLSWGGATFASGHDHVSGEILIGVDADGSLTNLKNAINGTGTADTDYDATTPPHSQVTAGAISAHAFAVTAKDYSVTNADVATTETGAHLSFGSTTLGSGVAKVVALNSSTYSGSAGISGDKNV